MLLDHHHHHHHVHSALNWLDGTFQHPLTTCSCYCYCFGAVGIVRQHGSFESGLFNKPVAPKHGPSAGAYRQKASLDAARRQVVAVLVPLLLLLMMMVMMMIRVDRGPPFRAVLPQNPFAKGAFIHDAFVF